MTSHSFQAPNTPVELFLHTGEKANDMTIKYGKNRYTIKHIKLIPKMNATAALLLLFIKIILITS